MSQANAKELPAAEKAKRLQALVGETLLGDSLVGSPTSRLATSVILAISLFPIFPASWALLA